MNNSSNTHAQAAMADSQEQLIADFKVVMNDAEALLKATANQGDAKLEEVRANARESLRAFNVRISDSQAALLAKSRDAARATDLYVHENPWAALGIASGIGFVVGLLLRRH
jgi:ElaB/YqjD/DUF883 family membrane-anchored ribosome-binding protein